MIRILHLITSSSRSPYLRDIVSHADRKRFEIVVGTISPEGPLHGDMRAQGIRTLTLDCGRRTTYPAGVVRLTKWLRQEKVDILQTHLYDSCVLGSLAGRLARTPVIVCTAHHSHEFGLKRRQPHFIADCAANRWLCNWVISPSRCVAELLVKEEHVPENKIVVIPYGFDFSRLRASERARERIREELSLDDGTTVFGTIGRLYWVKNHSALLNAFARLSGHGANIKLLIVGDGAERPSLESQSRQLGISEHVVFTGHRSDIFDVIAAMDVLVHPALAESFGQVICEGAALGKPIITTDVGCAREVVEDKVSGLLIPPDDIESLYQALFNMLTCSSDWAKMGKLGQRRVQQFTAERMVAAYQDHYIKWLR